MRAEEVTLGEVSRTQYCRQQRQQELYGALMVRYGD